MIATRSTLVNEIAESQGISLTSANSIIKAFCDSMETLLEKGYTEISIPHAFKLKVKADVKKGVHNMNDGEYRDIRYKRITFTPSKNWKKKIRGD